MWRSPYVIWEDWSYFIFRVLNKVTNQDLSLEVNRTPSRQVCCQLSGPWDVARSLDLTVILDYIVRTPVLPSKGEGSPLSSTQPPTLWHRLLFLSHLNVPLPHFNSNLMPFHDSVKRRIKGALSLHSSPRYSSETSNLPAVPHVNSVGPSAWYKSGDIITDWQYM